MSFQSGQLGGHCKEVHPCCAKDVLELLDLFSKAVSERGKLMDKERDLIRHIENLVNIVHKSYHDTPHGYQFCPFVVCKDSLAILKEYENR